MDLVLEILSHSPYSCASRARASVISWPASELDLVEADVNRTCCFATRFLPCGRQGSRLAIAHEVLGDGAGDIEAR